MRTAVVGALLLAMLVAALIVADALREPLPVPAMYVAPAPLPSVASVATRIEEIDRAAALMLAADARAYKAGMTIIAEGADAWAE